MAIPGKSTTYQQWDVPVNKADTSFLGMFAKLANAQQAKYEEKQNQANEFQQKLMLSAFPNLAATKQISPAAPGQGMTVGQGKGAVNVPWQWQAKKPGSVMLPLELPNGQTTQFEISDLDDLIKYYNAMDKANPERVSLGEAIAAMSTGSEYWGLTTMTGEQIVKKALDIVAAAKGYTTAEDFLNDKKAAPDKGKTTVKAANMGLTGEVKTLGETATNKWWLNK